MVCQGWWQAFLIFFFLYSNPIILILHLKKNLSESQRDEIITQDNEASN